MKNPLKSMLPCLRMQLRGKTRQSVQKVAAYSAEFVNSDRKVEKTAENRLPCLLEKTTAKHGKTRQNTASEGRCRGGIYNPLKGVYITTNTAALGPLLGSRQVTSTRGAA